MERLYYKDSYVDTFEAYVEYVCDSGVVLSETAFFPEGGGQTSDIGFLGEIPVYDVQEKDGVIYHKTENDSAFSAGDRVKGKIDFHKRFSDMQNHSGEHIVSGIVHNLFGYDNVGFHLNKNEVALDFSGVIPDDRIDEIELSANKAVWKNTEIRTFFPDEEERKSISYRSKKEISGSLRLVEIKDVDLCACCAPHVRRTGEIGIIKIVGHERHRGGTRMYILCGERALGDYAVKQNENYKISTLLKVPVYETSSGVEALLTKKCDLEYRIDKLHISQARKTADAYEKGEIIVAVDSFTGQSLTCFANYLSEKAEKLVATFGKTGENTYRYMLISKAGEIRALVGRMNTALSGKGGGRNGSAQGSVNCTENEIYEFFSEITASDIN